jgi:hypothetical protein
MHTSVRTIKRTIHHSRDSNAPFYQAVNHMHKQLNLDKRKVSGQLCRIARSSLSDLSPYYTNGLQQDLKLLN